VVNDGAGQAAAANGQILFARESTERKTDHAMALLAGPHTRTGADGNTSAGMVDLVVEETCKKERAARHLSAYLVAWKTMCLFRTLRLDEREIARTGGLHADFTDLAMAGSLVRKLFREGQWFPSRKNIFNKLTAEGEHTGFIHPITGKAVQFSHPTKPVRWPSLHLLKED